MKFPFTCLLSALFLAVLPSGFARAADDPAVPAQPVSAEAVRPVAPDVTDQKEILDVLSVKNMDIREVIEIIAQRSGLNIVMGQNFQGQVTIFLRNVDAREALRMVLESNGLAYADEGGIIRIMSATEYASRFGYSFGQERVTKLIRVHFASVADLAVLLNEIKSEQGKVIANVEAKNLVVMDTAEKVRAMEDLVREMDVQTVRQKITVKYAHAQDFLDDIRGLLTANIGTVEYDTATNSLVVTDTPTRVSKIKSAIEQMDARGRQICLQARLVHVVLNNEHLGGVDWSGIVEEYRNIRLWGAYDFLEGEAADRVLSLGVIAEDDFSTLLEALDTVGMVREYPLTDISLTQAEAVKVVVHMDDLTLDLGRVKAEEAVEYAGTALPGKASFEFFVRLAIDDEDKVEVGIVPHEQRSAKKAHRPAAHTASLLAAAGRSVVVGGLIATEKIATTRKIPLMGDLPLLGFAFRYHGSSVQREEFVVFLTPKIRNGKEQPGLASGEEAPVPAEEKNGKDH